MIKGAILLIVALFVGSNAEYLWRDEFDTFNRSAWEVWVTGTPYNNELQYYTDRPENLYAENGHLVIKPLKELYKGDQYTSARIWSEFNYRYGRIEVSAKLPDGYGLWPAIWLLPENDIYGGWPYSGEIDICEARGQNLHEIASTTHYQASWGHTYTSSGDLETQCSISDGFHLYTLDWTPTELVFRFDNNPYYRQSIDTFTSDYYQEIGQPWDEHFHLILNVAVGGWYLDDPTPDTQWFYPEAEMHVDYVRVTKLDDIATCGDCVVKPTSSTEEVCENVNWACFQQNSADVSSECTAELQNCCGNSGTNCDEETIYALASAVYTSYHNQVNDENSCHFTGTATRYCTLHDPQPEPMACVLDDSSSNTDICGSMQWACYDNTYQDVSSECTDPNGLAALDCCNIDPNTCDDQLLRTAAEEVFQLYYALDGSASGCDFGGICHLEGPVPIPCA